jgi:hypothetical protein
MLSVMIGMNQVELAEIGSGTRHEKLSCRRF